MPSRRFLAVVAIAVMALAGCAKVKIGQPAPDDMSLGDPSAKVQLTEYASASCSHCAAFDMATFPAFKAKYVDTGRVHYTLKEFLTPPEQVSAAGFLTARCAGKDRYFTVLDQIFRAQGEMFASGDFGGVLRRIAKANGLSDQQFDACIADKAALGALNKRVGRSADVDKIDATPTFVVNGKKVAEGEVSLADLDAAIAKASK
jgi:protein-disulfide isomerase